MRSGAKAMMLVASGLGLLASAGEARIRSLDVSAPISVAAGARCWVTVSAPRGLRGRLRLQERRGTSWRNVASAPLERPSSRLRYRTEGRAGQTLRLRAELRRGKRLVARSRTLEVRITRASSTLVATPRRGTVTRAADQVASVSGDPRGRLLVVLAHGVDPPEVGGSLVVPAGAGVPHGVLGRVVKVARLPAGRARVTTVPAALDQAYSRYRLSVAGTLGELGARATNGASTVRAADPINSLRPRFVCENGSEPAVSVYVDLSRLDFSAIFDANLASPFISVTLTGPLSVSVSTDVKEPVSCRAQSDLKLSFPLGATPIVAEIKPAFTLSASSAVNVGYDADAFLVFGFQRSKHGSSFDNHVFTATGTPTLSATATLKAFAGLNASLLLGGRAGVGGEVGPEVTLSASTTATTAATRACVTASSALNVGLNVTADVFFTSWTFDLANGSFGHRVLFDTCDGGGPGGPPEPPTPPPPPPPPRLPPTPDGRSIAAGEARGCGIRSDSTVSCWGYNQSGSLGDGTLVNSPTPVSVAGTHGTSQLAAGRLHTCALALDGAVACWGENVHGQLGDGTHESTTGPVSVSGLTDARQISADYYHTCALRAGGKVACWGFNRDGALGTGTDESSSVPVEVQGISDAVQVTTGDSFSCALRAGATVSCWGANGSGQLGNGMTENSLTPVAVNGIMDAEQVTASADSACVLRRDKTIACWGTNDQGQLGNGSTTPSLTPTPVTGITDATQIAGGIFFHNCAVRRSGGVSCWGYNGYGALGSGSGELRSTVPVDVVGIENAEEVAAGIHGGCARLRDGSARCWGSGDSGELGNGGTTSSTVPVTVVNFP